MSWIIEALRAVGGATVAICGDDEALTYEELTDEVEFLRDQLLKETQAQEILTASGHDRTDLVLIRLAILAAGRQMVLASPPEPTRVLDLTMYQGRTLRVECGELEGPTVLGAAYVTFTSGTTGPSKAIAVPGPAVRSYVEGVIQSYDLPAELRTLCVAPPDYDAWLREVLVTLVSGGTLVMLDRARVLDPKACCDAIVANGCTCILSSTPTFLMHMGFGESLPSGSLRLVACSGESVLPMLQSGLRPVPHGCRLINQYGPSETTMTATFHDIDVDSPSPQEDCVGIALPGVEVSVHDASGEMCDHGIVGEIWLSGRNVAWGYPGLPGLTSSRFVALSDGPPGSRAYRTGDLGHLSASNGKLVLIGRADRQFKIRGYRVEPSGIEARVREMIPGHDAVVVPYCHGESTCIALYLGSRDAMEHPTPAMSAVRAMLRTGLRPFEVPRQVTVIDELPRTRTGKIDYDRLVRDAETA